MAAVYSRIRKVGTIEDALQDAHFVLESDHESIDIKQRNFALSDRVCPPHTILATNTSSLLPTQIASVVSPERRAKCVGAHFFKPAWSMPIVEVVRGEQTSDSTMDVTCELMGRIGKQPARLEHEISGYIVNRVQIAMVTSAAGLLAAGIPAEVMTPQLEMLTDFVNR